MNLGLANWKIKYKHTWLFYSITAWLISTNGPSPPGLLPLPRSGTLDPSSKEAKSKVVTPPSVVQALTYDCQCLPSLSTMYKVMGSPPVLDGARHCRPAELDVKVVHGTRAQVECHLPLLWTVLRHSPPRCKGISPGPMSRETGHMISCCFGHPQLAPMLIYRIPIFPRHSE